MGTVAVVALGYNSLWEKNRRNYDKWAKKFDDEAEAMIAELTTLGAKKIVWVTLREPTADTVPAKAVKELPQYSWYFPWANERIHAIQQRHPEVAARRLDGGVQPQRDHVRFDPPQPGGPGPHGGRDRQGRRRVEVSGAELSHRRVLVRQEA